LIKGVLNRGLKHVKGKPRQARALIPAKTEGNNIRTTLDTPINSLRDPLVSTGPTFVNPLRHEQV
jgi:hypothetical protein